MKNILVPIGTSKNASRHLQYAIDFAEAFGAKLFVIQVYNVYTRAGTMIKVDKIIERESLKTLKRLVARINTKGVDITIKVLKGDLIDTLEMACKAADIDLLMVEPRTTSVKDEVFLGKTSGKIIKHTQIPALIVPEKTVFKPFENILFAVKSALLRKPEALNPLREIKMTFNAKVNLLLVKTTFYKPSDFNLGEEMKGITDTVQKTENPTTYQGVLQHQESIKPDLLCVVRRKRGFFTKQWEKNVILKKEFSSKIPVLVLSGLK
ncbi:universal stress protein [Gaetbulibacter aestuarii]|uniref:Universal stress protein n=1 Tax=Gaetbulibacter aestuarii TaxID=1502358 RepID=A0ABW7MWG5_9FLAO